MSVYGFIFIFLIITSLVNGGVRETILPPPIIYHFGKKNHLIEDVRLSKIPPYLTLLELSSSPLRGENNDKKTIITKNEPI